MAVNLPCIDFTVSRSQTAHTSWSGWKGVASWYWMYSSTKWGYVVINHRCTYKFPVFMAVHKYKWYSRPISDNSSNTNHNFTTGRSLSTSRVIGGLRFDDGVVNTCELNTYWRYFFLILSSGIASLLGGTLLLASLVDRDIHAGLLSTSRILLGKVACICPGWGGSLLGLYWLDRFDSYNDWNTWIMRFV